MPAASSFPSLWFSAENRRWITGFTGSSGVVLVRGTTATLYTDGRYATQAASEVYDGTKVEIVQDILAALVKEMSRKTAVGRRCYFEQNALSYAQWQTWIHALGDVLLIPFGEGLNCLRQLKGHEELASLKEAGRIADQALEEVLSCWGSCRTEDDVRRALESACYRRGSRIVPFEFIVAQGVRSALPHGVASRNILNNQPITIDWGAEYDGYYSDQTVTIVPDRGCWDHKWQQRYEQVFLAQQAGLARICAGAITGDIDFACRTVLSDVGLGDLFVHSTGHGVGLAIHEEPRLTRNGTDILDTGAVVTVEPGVYEEGWGGIRLEDTVAVTDGGYERLTQIDKQQPLFLG